MPFCIQCGKRISFDAEACGACGHPTMHERVEPIGVVSPKSFGVAVALCGVFGTVGLHHFYLGNVTHGLIDIGLFVASMFCLFSGHPGLLVVGFVLLFADLAHTCLVFYRLIVGKETDGAGRLVVFPGQTGR